MGSRPGVKINEIEKTFCHKPAAGNTRAKKTNGITNECLR